MTGRKRKPSFPAARGRNRTQEQTGLPGRKRTQKDARADRPSRPQGDARRTQQETKRPHVLLAHARDASTETGDGLALPHPRKPIVLGLSDPLLTCFGAADHKPVHTMFVLVTSSVRGHLRMLGHLMRALQDAAFRTQLTRRAGLDPPCTELSRIESAIGIAAARWGGAS